ncbi:uncharacterized protein LOC108142793 isoform X2 [Drosophila elegans]|uniref:uncharacterized protein LOC108142793 isoform X2 n=1 Tax=Drosophila elegans TaxID=30023 RepID=UPI0007E835BE|nr:uncharacterized protein LOC108142793 isoform X2 [Drosophila elegans]
MPRNKKALITTYWDNEEPVSKKAYFVWTPHATECLLEMWMENLPDFYGSRKNSHIMREMAASMKDDGITMVEVKAKMDNMKKRYRKELQTLSTSDTKRSKWEYFCQMRLIMEYNDYEFESDADSMPKSSYNESSQVQKKSPKELQTDNEASDSSTEFEFPEPEVNRYNSKRSHAEMSDDSKDEIPTKNLRLAVSMKIKQLKASIPKLNQIRQWNLFSPNSALSAISANGPKLWEKKCWPCKEKHSTSCEILQKTFPVFMKSS